MFTRPTDLTDDEVAAAVVDHWASEPDEITYAPVGFGSHHWWVTAGADRWFVTVDDLDPVVVQVQSDRFDLRWGQGQSTPEPDDLAR